MSMQTLDLEANMLVGEINELQIVVGLATWDCVGGLLFAFSK